MAFLLAWNSSPFFLDDGLEFGVYYLLRARKKEIAGSGIWDLGCGPREVLAVSIFLCALYGVGVRRAERFAS